MHTPLPGWVKSGKSQSEQKFSALLQRAVTYARASSTGGGKAGGVVVSLRRAKRSSSDRMAAWSATRARIRRSLLRLSRMAEAALRIGSRGQWIALPARCGRAAAIADHMQARRPATISRLSAAPMRPDGGGMIELAPAFPG